MAGVFAAMLWGFHAMILHHAPDMFRAPQEDMSFGWYVPLFSLYVVWTERKKILGSLGAPSWAGLLAALPFLALGFLGVRGAAPFRDCRFCRAIDNRSVGDLRQGDC